MSQHFYRPSEGHRLPHDPFNAIVAPRPIGWIGTLGVDGRRNLAPYSFFNAFNYRPPIVGFASIGHKHTVTNLEATGEFTWNLVTRGLVDKEGKKYRGLERIHEASSAHVAKLAAAAAAATS